MLSMFSDLHSNAKGLVQAGRLHEALAMYQALDASYPPNLHTLCGLKAIYKEGEPWPVRGYTRIVTVKERLNDKRAEVLSTAARHGAHNVRMIGSVARGDARPDSDLDLLVELDTGRSLLDHAALMVELEALLGCKVDIATEQGLRPRVRDRVLAEAVPL
jgi:predicted nucleotidyltransferase